MGWLVTRHTKGTGGAERSLLWERSHEHVRAYVNMFEHGLGGYAQRPARVSGPAFAWRQSAPTISSGARGPGWIDWTAREPPACAVRGVACRPAPLASREPQKGYRNR